MSDTNDILMSLQSKGFRLTKARKALVDIFSKSISPLSAAEINTCLEKSDVSVNKTTIYREIAFLIHQNIVRELQFGDGRRRFELFPDNHHHHLICVKCESIECVELESCLKAEEKRIFRNNNFKTLKHSLKFMGLCAKCQ